MLRFSKLLPPVQQTTQPVQQTTADNSQNDNETTTPSQQTDSIQYEFFSYDYPYYNTISDMANKANEIFSGEVKNISFEMLNMETMQPLKDGEDFQWAMIFTIYGIEVEEVYSGAPTTVKLRIEGGISSGFEQEQIAVLGNNRVPVMEGVSVLAIGSKCLFVLYHADGTEYSSILNPQQSIYTDNSGQDIGFSAEEVISYFFSK